MKNGSAEILGFEDARARLRAPEIDPANFVAVGPYLEAVREQQGLSLAAVSEKTKIKAVFLEAIEQMALGSLPSKAVAIGFVRGYAEALGLAQAPIVTRFKEEAGYEARPHPDEPHAEEQAHPARAEPAEAPRLSLFAFIGIFAFILACLYLVTHPKSEIELRTPGVPTASEPAAGQAVVDPEAAAAAIPPGSAPDLPQVVEAAVIERVEPVYPPTCSANAQPTETVAVAFTITAEGGVVSERILETSNPCFDRAALNALKRWRFAPRTIDGAPRPAFEQRATFNFEKP
jgi:TonB family protein